MGLRQWCPKEEDAAQPPAAGAYQAGDPLPPGATAVATVPETPPPSGHNATRPTACEVASGLEATRHSGNKALAPLLPEEDAAQPTVAAAGQVGDPLPLGATAVATVLETPPPRTMMRRDGPPVRWRLDWRRQGVAKMRRWRRFHQRRTPLNRPALRPARRVTLCCPAPHR